MGLVVKYVIPIVILLVALRAFGADIPPEWSACEADSDCVNITYECSGGTVNRKFAALADEIFRKENARGKCAYSPEATAVKIPFKVFCREKRCGSQGKNPKVGFS